MFQQRLDQWNTKDKMGTGDFEDLTGDELFRKILDPLGSGSQSLVVHHRDFLEDIFAVKALGTGSLIAVPFLEMIDKPIQLPVVHPDQFPDFQVKDLAQLRDLHDIHMFRLDEVLQMDGGKCPLPRKGEKVQEIPLIAPVLIGLHMFYEERGSFKSLRDLKMVVTEALIVTEIFRPDPRGFEKFHRVHQFSVKAEVTWILEIAVLILLSAPRGMAIVVDMFEIIRTLPKADIVDDQL